MLPTVPWLEECEEMMGEEQKWNIYIFAPYRIIKSTLKTMSVSSRSLATDGSNTERPLLSHLMPEATASSQLLRAAISDKERPIE